MKLGRLRGTLSAEHAREHLEALRHVPSWMEQMIRQEVALMPVAKRCASARDVLFLGRGAQYPVALEGALKLKEISYIHAEGYPAAEMKHGPIALIDERMPVLVLCGRFDRLAAPRQALTPQPTQPALPTPSPWWNCSWPWACWSLSHRRNRRSRTRWSRR